ncbi:hypothetical protein BKA69DRAFT_1053273 [Paraphysoderma sedebokerense]|nr:hypothetical protein BKA69DRAFT_1053273 [Paraphysoderma sedebokerense]
MPRPAQPSTTPPQYNPLSKEHYVSLSQSKALTATSRKYWLLTKHQIIGTAKVVTLEPKYHVCSCVAEFYCTLTSPFFALPVLIYLDHSISSIPVVLNCTIWFSVLCAIVSTLYHATLFNVFSTLDACIATITFYLNAIAVLSAISKQIPSFLLPIFAVAENLGFQDEASSATNPSIEEYLQYHILGISVIFITRHGNTAKPALIMTAGLLPFIVYGYIVLNRYDALVTGLIGIACFLLDRRKICQSHAFWHVFGGVSLYLGLKSTVI